MNSVPYDNLEEFADLWNDCCEMISDHIAQHLQSQLSHASLTGSTRLVWLDMDMIMYGIPNLEHVKQYTQFMLREVMKQTNYTWCCAANDAIMDRVNHTSRIYFDTIRNHCVPVDRVFYHGLMQMEVISLVGNITVDSRGLPFIMNQRYLVQDVFDSSFVMNSVAGDWVTCWSYSTREELLLLCLLAVNKGHGLLGNIDKDLFQIIHKFVLTNDVFTGGLIV